MLLWILFAILTAAALGVVLRPLFTERGTSYSRSSYDIAVYKDQLKELDQDIDRGLINETEGKTAKAEISRRLIASAESKDQKAVGDSAEKRSPTLAIAFSLLAAPLLTLGLYLNVGSPDMPAQPLSARFDTPKNLEHIKGLIRKVEKHLSKNPNDGQGWEILAPVYLKLRRFDDAVFAYKQVMKIRGENAGRLAAYGDAVVRANNGVVTEEAKLAFQRSLILRPGQMLPRVRLTFGLEQESKKEEAVKSWTEIYRDSKGNETLSQMAKMRIEILTGKKFAGLVQDTGQPKEEKLKNPTSQDIKNAQQMSSGDRMAMVRSMVKGLSARLSEKGGSVQEWMRLIRSYSVMGEKDLALKAWKDAEKNLKDNPKALAELNVFAKQLGLSS